MLEALISLALILAVLAYVGAMWVLVYAVVVGLRRLLTGGK